MNNYELIYLYDIMKLYKYICILGNHNSSFVINLL